MLDVESLQYTTCWLQQTTNIAHSGHLLMNTLSYLVLDTTSKHIETSTGKTGFWAANPYIAITGLLIVFS